MDVSREATSVRIHPAVTDGCNCDCLASGADWLSAVIDGHRRAVSDRWGRLVWPSVCLVRGSSAMSRWVLEAVI